MTIRTIAAVGAGALWLVGCAVPYTEPPAGVRTATVDFIRPLGSTSATILRFDDAKSCSGPRTALKPTDATQPIRVLAGVPTALGATFIRTSGMLQYRCGVSATFMPQPGKQYKMTASYPTNAHVCRAGVVESDDGKSWHAFNVRYRTYQINQAWGTGSCPDLTDADVAFLRDKTRSPDGATTLSDLSDLLPPQ
ncbi:hypothetical protein PQH03_15510 [Ralstonia insidiosa]|jgi:hypothetical protein|uniref:hypothetical protein n=1 Tax=Ralstonia TaxID=48736 RepID=UPI000664A557|nr:hypothetical protein [Ralstonia insidiosa]KMW47149.1 hypothetical protein AC240_11620 [Ralstonia sp. MD27]MBX3775645.1 hypothetical protein [Ralstonia pickettii]NOZ19335.1 hypothetical protein [Betaproteobacteria bacterium]MBA9860016.1 hypothetical protein [Ralstonia insidiosa]MBA9873564.1 hypothetical protein [Ralstonia insidiosa]